MLIQVSYSDERFDYVKDFMLDQLIDSGQITGFRRTSGWVTVGVDPVRKRSEAATYQGLERRGSLR
jgi:hypothetical protein